MRKLTRRLNILDAVSRLHTAKALLEKQAAQDEERLRDAVKSMTSVLAIYFSLEPSPRIQARHVEAIDEFFAALADEEVTS